MTMDTETFARTFLALGPPTILLAGIAVTVVLASALGGARRWWVLAGLPLLTLGVALGATILVMKVLRPGDGSGFLLGAAALGVYTMALTVYYPILGGVGLWVALRRDPPGRGSLPPDSLPRDYQARR